MAILTSRGGRLGRVVSSVAAALVAVYAAACLIVPSRVDSEKLKARLQSRLSELLGHEVSLRRLEFRLWTGPVVAVEGLEIAPAVTAGDPGRWRFDARSVSVRPALLALLRGDFRIASVSVAGGTVATAQRTVADRLALRLRIQGEVPGEGLVKGTLRGSLAIVPSRPDLQADFGISVRGGAVSLSRIRARLGALRIEAAGRADGFSARDPRAELQGRAEIGRTVAVGSFSVEHLVVKPRLSFRVTSEFVDFDEIASLVETAGAGSAASASLLVPSAHAAIDGADETALTGLSGEGTLEADRGRFAGLEMSGLRARLGFEGGAVRFEEASFDLYGGRHRGVFAIDLAKAGRPFTLRDRLERVDLSRLVRAFSPSLGAALHGTATLNLDVAGISAQQGWRRTLAGAGRVEVLDGRLTTVGILARVAGLLELAGGRGIGREETPFRQISASFGILQGKAATRDLVFRSADLDLDGGGTVGLDGGISLSVVAAFSRAASQGFVGKTPQLKFRLGADGRLTIPLRLDGSLVHPEIRLDLDRILREGLEQSLFDRGKSGVLRRLLGED